MSRRAKRAVATWRRKSPSGKLAALDKEIARVAKRMDACRPFLGEAFRNDIAYHRQAWHRQARNISAKNRTAFLKTYLRDAECNLDAFEASERVCATPAPVAAPRLHWAQR